MQTSHSSSSKSDVSAPRDPENWWIPDPRFQTYVMINGVLYSLKIRGVNFDFDMTKLWIVDPRPQTLSPLSCHLFQFY
jgi:hypothetical protein